VRRILVFAVALTAVAGGITLALGLPEEKAEPESAAVETQTTTSTAASTPKPPPAQAAAPEVTARVAMVRLKFKPSVVRIDAGEAVRFDNRDDVPHDVTADGALPGSGLFASGPIPPRDRFIAAPRAGTYRYVCTIHPTVMRGRIVVSAL